MARAFALGSLIIGGLIIADLLAHRQTTSQIIGAGTTESRLLAGQKG